MIIDAHAHSYDILSGYGARGEFRPLGHGKGIWATGEVEQFLPEQYGDLGFSTETLIHLMDENHVDRAVLLQGGNYGFHNDYAAESAKRYPDRLTAVGTLDPYGRYAEQILEHFVCDYNFRALKFEVSETWGLTGYHPDLKFTNTSFAPILSRANELGMTIVIDMGPKGTRSFDPEQFIRLRQDYPNILFVMTHCFFPCNDGANAYRIEWMRRLASDHFFFDIANLPNLVWPEPYPFPSQQIFLQEAKKAVGAERLIWGTDLPSTLTKFTYREMIEFVTGGTIFNSRELELIMAENAKHVYHIRA